jgi:hypothetical protein
MDLIRVHGIIQFLQKMKLSHEEINQAMGENGHCVVCYLSMPLKIAITSSAIRKTLQGQPTSHL